jgi:hypothetical protein
LQAPIFLALSVVVTGLALFLSLKQRFLDRLRTIVLRSLLIWTAATILVIVAVTQLLGTPSLALAIVGLLVVMLLAGMAGAGR